MANKLGLEVNSKAVAFSKDELVRAVAAETELPVLMHHKINIPTALVDELQADLNEVLQSVLDRLMKAAPVIDAKNGEGYTATLCEGHKVICSLFSSKSQNKAHKQLAVKQGLIPASVFISDTAAPVAGTGEVIDIDLDI